MTTLKITHVELGQGVIEEFDGTAVHIKFGKIKRRYYIPLLLASESFECTDSSLSILNNHIEQILPSPKLTLEEKLDNCRLSNDNPLKDRLDNIKKMGQKIPKRAIDDRKLEDFF